MKNIWLLTSMASVIPMVLAGACAMAWTQAAATTLPYDSRMKWMDDHGQQVTLEQFKGKTVLMTMAYSTCSKTCLISLKKLEEFQALLDQQKRSAEIVIVSYDPRNDTPKSWAEYRAHHKLQRDNWHFLVGNEKDTKYLSRLLGLQDFWSMDDHVFHDFKISVIDQGGTIVHQIDWQSLNSKELP